jgi:MFS family permease
MVTRDALPMIGVLVLRASPLQMGLLSAAGSAPVLLVGLLAGAWVDRLHRRPILIAADLGRAILVVSIPAPRWPDRSRAVLGLGPALSANSPCKLQKRKRKKERKWNRTSACGLAAPCVRVS